MDLNIYKAAFLQTTSYRILRESVNSILEKYNLSVFHWGILGTVSKLKTPTPLDISKHLGISKPNITIGLQMLLENKFVKVTLNEKDRRSKNIELTPLAQLLIPKLEEEITKNMKMLLSDLTDEELQVYFKVLSVLIRNGEKLSKLVQYNKR